RAREFSSLTGRVAEFAGIEAAEIEPDANFMPGGEGKSPAGSATARQEVSPPPGGRAASPGKPAETPAPAKVGTAAAVPAAFTPQSLAAARIDAARHGKVDRSRYEIVRTAQRLNAWIARARGL